MKHLSLFYLCVSVCVLGGGGGKILNQGEQQIQVFMYYYLLLGVVSRNLSKFKQ